MYFFFLSSFILPTILLLLYSLESHTHSFNLLVFAGSNESHLGSIASYDTRKELEKDKDKDKDKDRDKDKDKPASHMLREGSLRSVFSSSGVSLDSFSNNSTTLQNNVISPIAKNVLTGTKECSACLSLFLSCLFIIRVLLFHTFSFLT